MGETLTRLIGRILWPLIKGSSKITFDRENGRVSKVYQPGILVRVLHFLAIQKWTFLYEREIGLRIAGYRREVVKYVLQCGLGEKCRVASFLSVEPQGGKLALVTELIEGRQPRNQSEVSGLLEELTALFVRAGLPTWSICPHNPRAYTNIIIGTDQIPVIVDLESLLLGIFVPLEELRDNVKAGNFPPHDDTCFPKLWRFYREVKDSLTDGGRRFRFCIEECERLTREQKSGEIRVWSRVLNFFVAVLGARKE